MPEREIWKWLDGQDQPLRNPELLLGIVMMLQKWEMDAVGSLRWTESFPVSLCLWGWCSVSIIYALGCDVVYIQQTNPSLSNPQRRSISVLSFCPRGHSVVFVNQSPRKTMCQWYTIQHCRRWYLLPLCPSIQMSLTLSHSQPGITHWSRNSWEKHRRWPSQT